MAVNCFVGRGSLLVSPLGAGRGFFTLSGESEITVEIDEDNESVNDARNGVIERVDWFVRGYRVRVLADCFRIEQDSIALLLKTTHTAVAADEEGEWELPTVVVGRGYFTAPNLDPETIVITDSLDAVVDESKYTVDGPYGLITFLDIAGFTQPFTVVGETTGHASYALHGTNHVLVEAMMKGVNIQSEEKVMAHFYRLALDVTDQLKLVQKSFSSMQVRMQATPDLSQTADAALGYYGRIILLG